MLRGQPVVDEVLPEDAFRILSESPDTAMVDVRCKAEWAFVGIPDLAETGRPLWLIEWASYPTMASNESFVDELAEAMGGSVPERLFFICRSGQRSLAAAMRVAGTLGDAGPAHCTNVTDGFEGPLDRSGHRGTAAGWKASGLPWRQQ